MRSQKAFSPTFSFELFPPQTPEGIEKLRATRKQLAQFNPKFFSVTFGAGGSTRDRTFETVSEILAEGHPVAPHLSCIGSTRENIFSILKKYQESGIRHIVALRGDLPSGMAQPGEFRYANELVTFVRKEFGDTFHMEVAAYPEYHPQARSAQEDFKNFKNKIEAGADSAITQFFYNADAYFHFVDMCEAANLNVPIVPGIMPINKFSQLVRFADTCGAEVPRWIRKKLESYGDDIASIHAFGLDVVTELCERLLKAGAPGLHFYTLNSAVLTTKIWQRLGL
ncbi:MAG TPA: methylenetetrahydrofolate reductase [NAD(P)H] [Nitrosomonas nitrosa]|uniref:Methylenetetrahydrofolate reductase n=1 Tax=Nitrosomonas nitrosa TaxID=52442 RepID=A0A8H8Z1X0_9PROT|nr:methylenetetrahydrofolate reductase [NAD(P)H] [Nitrosomonas nitrosa]MCW5598724.1 methylenetetrahydrofolate reductase [NAD(P)H] [Nitrosomonas sp.]MCO6434414.1 methylenetetrahydrofolate reductase [NAD(P)H] [Nitrosomonas nitrosa]PTR04746.1 5,10-methylenetetrahydrofolate reductase (NAD(P)) [Nitrosomonas nitrosa]CAE6503740.1 5,10-methylenetetrahydrofolate reductase [Nitrosomonas nitrosa]HBZ31091.1 methylenetetrahydrofolate reductase [NAD(P)H] [Nitrosomonas nitrosa]